MHDIRLIRDNPESFDAALARRGVAPVSESLLALDARRREVATRMQEAQSRRNEASKAIGAAMAKGDKDAAEALKAEVAALKTTLPALEDEERQLSAQAAAALAALPNLPPTSCPRARTKPATWKSRWGTPRHFAFAPREHADLGPALGLDLKPAR
jgi:seryl-tRNA synthetase